MRKIIALHKEIKNSVRPHNNERGFIMGAVLLLSLLLLIIITMAIWSATNENRIVASAGNMMQEFYHTESGIVSAVNHSDLWLTSDFVTGASDTVYAKMLVYDDGNAEIYEANPSSLKGKTTNPGSGATQVAEVQIRQITSYDEDGKPVRVRNSGGGFVLWEEADEYPNMPYVGASSSGSSDSFGRYFVLTAKDVNNNSTVQIGFIQDYVNP